MIAKYPEPPRKENIPTPGTQEQALADLAYLWKCDDPEWVNQREADWQKLVVTAFDEYPKSEKKALERYFKYGEKSAYIPVGDFFFLTPYNSAESLLQLFNSRLLSDNDRGSMYTSYVFDADRFVNCSFHKQHTTLFVEVILGEVYCEVVEQTSPSHISNISPPSTWWCNLFIRNAIKSLSSRTEWKPFYHCVNYFITALPYATNEKQRKRSKLPELLQLATDCLAEDDLSGSALIFVKELKDREQEILEAWDIGEQKIATMNQKS